MQTEPDYFLPMTNLFLKKIYNLEHVKVWATSFTAVPPCSRPKRGPQRLPENGFEGS